MKVTAILSPNAHPPHIRFEDSVVRHSERRHVFRGGTKVVYDHHYANYSPGADYLANLPAGRYSIGYIEHDPVVLKTEEGIPQVMTLRSEVFASPRSDGTF